MVIQVLKPSIDDDGFDCYETLDFVPFCDLDYYLLTFSGVYPSISLSSCHFKVYDFVFDCGFESVDFIESHYHSLFG